MPTIRAVPENRTAMGPYASNKACQPSAPPGARERAQRDPAFELGLPAAFVGAIWVAVSTVAVPSAVDAASNPTPNQADFNCAVPAAPSWPTGSGPFHREAFGSHGCGAGWRRGAPRILARWRWPGGRAAATRRPPASECAPGPLRRHGVNRRAEWPGRAGSRGGLRPGKRPPRSSFPPPAFPSRAVSRATIPP